MQITNKEVIIPENFNEIQQKYLQQKSTSIEVLLDLSSAANLVKNKAY